MANDIKGINPSGLGSIDTDIWQREQEGELERTKKRKPNPQVAAALYANSVGVESNQFQARALATVQSKSQALPTQEWSSTAQVSRTQADEYQQLYNSLSPEEQQEVQKLEQDLEQGLKTLTNNTPPQDLSAWLAGLNQLLVKELAAPTVTSADGTSSEGDSQRQKQKLAAFFLAQHLDEERQAFSQDNQTERDHLGENIADLDADMALLREKIANFPPDEPTATQNFTFTDYALTPTKQELPGIGGTVTKEESTATEKTVTLTPAAAKELLSELQKKRRALVNAQDALASQQTAYNTRALCLASQLLLASSDNSAVQEVFKGEAPATPTTPEGSTGVTSRSTTTGAQNEVDPSELATTNSAFTDTSKTTDDPLSSGSLAGMAYTSTDGSTNTRVTVATNSLDTDNKILDLMQQAVQGINEDIQAIALRIQDNLNLRNTIVKQSQDIQEMVDGWADDGSEKEVTYTAVSSDGSSYVTKTDKMTKAQAQEKIKDMENIRGTLADISQQDQVLLQNALQKQQQAIQLMSNILKMDFDTAKAIIGNIRS